MSTLDAASAHIDRSHFVSTLADADIHFDPPPGAAKPSYRSAPGVDRPFEGTTFIPRTENADKNDPVKTIYLQDPSGDPDIAPALVELKSIGDRRGFDVNISSGATPDVWAEDAAILFKDKGGQAALLVSSIDPEVFKRAHDQLSALKGHGNELGDAQDLGRAFIDGLSSRVGDSAAKAGWSVRRTSIAIDGGNLLTTQDAKGETTALVGRNSLLVNWLALKENGGFDSKVVARMVADKKFDPAVAAQIKQIYGAGGHRMNDAQASAAAAELDIVKGRIADALHLDKSHVVFIEQAGFHIDMETRPLGAGVVVVSDLRKSLQTLDAAIASTGKGPEPKGISIEKRPREPGAPDTGTARTFKKLTDLRKRTMEGIASGDQRLLDEKAASLERAGFKVIRVAANFGGIGSGSGGLYNPEINFANGISAIDKNGKPYLITNRSDFEALNNGFKQTMQSQGIDVEFVSTGDLLARQGGIDCITLQKDLGKRPL